MDKGQHPMLLNELRRQIANHDPRLRETVEQARICSRRPGAATYDNKCEFPGGYFVAVKRNENNVALQLVWGYGSNVACRAPNVIDIKSTAYEIRAYAHDMAPWVARKLLEVLTLVPK